MTMLALGQIEADRRAQLRAQLDEATVLRYVELYQVGVKFPALEVFFDRTEQLYFLADGFHRYEAALRVGKERLHVHVREGTLRDAILYAAQANAQHGLPRNDADKRKAVLVFLADMEWRRWSDREIARRCRVSDRMVNRLRAEIEAPLPVEPEPTRLARRNGRIYPMKVRERKLRKPVVLPVNGASDVGPEIFDELMPPVSAAPVAVDYRQELVLVELRERVYQLEAENAHLRVLLGVLGVKA